MVTTLGSYVYRYTPPLNSPGSLALQGCIAVTVSFIASIVLNALVLTQARTLVLTHASDYFARSACDHYTCSHRGCRCAKFPNYSLAF